MIFKKKKKTNANGIVDINVTELVEKRRFPTTGIN